MAILIFTYALAHFYTGGDQAGYRKAYVIVRGVDPVAGFRLYRSIISTVEIGHYAITYVASNLLIDKNIIFSYMNAVLAILLMRALRRLNADERIALVLVLSNFYIIVLYVAAERLKVAAVLLMLALEVARGRPLRYVLGVLSASAHLTIVLLYGRVVGQIALYLKSNIHQTVTIVALLLIVMTAILSWYLLNGYLWWKAMQYMQTSNISLFSAVPLILCIMLSMLTSKEKKFIVLDFFPVVAAFVFFGGARTNMFAYITFIKHGIQEKRGLNVFVLASVVYMIYKSCLFVVEVVKTGQGF